MVVHRAKAGALLTGTEWEAADTHLSAVVDHGTLGAAEDFDLADGTDHIGTLDQNLTVTLSGATNGEAGWMTLKLTQDGTGTNTIDLPASVVNASDVEGAFDPAANAVNIISLFTYDGGSTWYAFLAGRATLASARYVRSSGNYAITGAGSDSFAAVDNTNMSFTLPTGAHRVLLGFSGSVIVNNAAGGTCWDIQIDGSRVGGSTNGLVFHAQHATAETGLVAFTYLTDVLSAGSHTFKLMWRQFTTSHTATLNGSDPVAIFYAVEQSAD